MNVRLTWELPTPTPRQRPLQATRIEFRAAGINDWTVQDTVPEPTVELVFVDVAPGDYEYQATVIDIDGHESIPVQTSVSVVFDDPDPVINFTAVVE